VTIAPALLREYPAMNKAQRAVISHDDGPLLVIAGPGSGKTFSLVLRALDLLLLNKAVPRELIICTFTEKAAFELRDRISAAAQKVGYTGDLSELRVGTIHGLCNRLLTEHRHGTPLGNNYETLDELTQLLFIFEHFGDIIGAEANGQYSRSATIFFGLLVHQTIEEIHRLVLDGKLDTLKECDLRSYCFREGTIKLWEADL